MEHIGTRLKKLREDKNLSPEALRLSLDARKELNLKVSRETIDKWERGTRTPNAEAVVALALYYGVSADYILGLEEYWATHNALQITAVTLGLSDRATENLISMRSLDGGLLADVLTDVLESPKLEETLRILKKSKADISRQIHYCQDYEEKYGLKVPEKFLEEAVDLSDTYIIKAIRGVDTLLRDALGFDEVRAFQEDVQHGEHKEN